MKHTFLTMALVATAMVAGAQNKAGLVTLRDCPTTNEIYRAQFVNEESSGDQWVDIYYNGTRVQMVEDLFVAPVTDGNMVHYVDANFDGYPDVFVGTGESRSANALILWDKQAGRFKLSDVEMLQNPVFDAAGKRLYTSGSASADEYVFNCAQWKGSKPVVTQSVYCRTADDGTVTYTLLSPDGRVQQRTTRMNELPAHFQRVMKMTEF